MNGQPANRQLVGWSEQQQSFWLATAFSRKAFTPVVVEDDRPSRASPFTEEVHLKPAGPDRFWPAARESFWSRVSRLASALTPGLREKTAGLPAQASSQQKRPESRP